MIYLKYCQIVCVIALFHFFQGKKPISGYLDSFHVNAKLTFLLNWKFIYVDVIVKYNRIYIIHSFRIMKIIGIVRCVLTSFNPKHRHLIIVYRGAPFTLLVL